MINTTRKNAKVINLITIQVAFIDSLLKRFQKDVSSLQPLLQDVEESALPLEPHLTIHPVAIILQPPGCTAHEQDRHR